MTKAIKVRVRQGKADETASAEVQFESFFDPLVGLEKLVGQPARARFEADRESRTLKASAPIIGGELGQIQLRLDDGPAARNLIVTFADGGAGTLEALRDGDQYTLVVNHEEQYSVKR